MKCSQPSASGGLCISIWYRCSTLPRPATMRSTSGLQFGRRDVGVGQMGHRGLPRLLHGVGRRTGDCRASDDQRRVDLAQPVVDVVAAELGVLQEAAAAAGAGPDVAAVVREMAGRDRRRSRPGAAGRRGARRLVVARLVDRRVAQRAQPPQQRRRPAAPAPTPSRRSAGARRRSRPASRPALAGPAARAAVRRRQRTRCQSPARQRAAVAVAAPRSAVNLSP